MARSKKEIPHYYLAAEIDMRRALAWLAQENLQRPITERILPAAVLLKAVALAVREVPELNGFWMDGAFRPGEGVHLGVAVSVRGGGLIAPAIHDADQKSLGELMAALEEFTVTVTFCFTPEHRGLEPHHTSPPIDIEEYADFCARMVRRYAPPTGIREIPRHKGVPAPLPSGSDQ